MVYAVTAAVLLSASTACPDDHLKDIDKVRTSMTDIGYRLPKAINSTKPENIRTLERVFEINNYALVTIESYLKMLKVFSLSPNRNFKETLVILNSWLNFIASYCASDIKYLDEARAEMKGEAEKAIVGEEVANITKLMEAAQKGIDENSKAFGDL